MKTSILLLGTASLIFTAGAGAQNPQAVKPAPGAPATATAAPAKPKPFASSDTRIYITLAEAMQFQLKASDRLRGHPRLRHENRQGRHLTLHARRARCRVQKDKDRNHPDRHHPRGQGDHHESGRDEQGQGKMARRVL